MTIAIAIIISAVNALTLSPALAAILLKPKHNESKKQGGILTFFNLFNAGFEATKTKYIQAVTFLSGKKWMAVMGVVVFSCLMAVLMFTTPAAFVPEEDMGTIFVNISLPPASALERTTAVANEVAVIAKSIPQVKSVLCMGGNSMTAGSGSSYGMVILELKNWSERKGITNKDIIETLLQRTSKIKEASIMPFAMPTIMGFGIGGGFSFELQDKGGHTINEFYKVCQDFLVELNKRSEIQMAYTTYCVILSVKLGRTPGFIERSSLDGQQISYDIKTGVPASLLANRPDVMEAEYHFRYSFDLTNVARSYFYPSVNISANGGLSETDLARLFNANTIFWNLTGGLIQPIFNQGINNQRLKIAKANQEEYLAAFKQTILNAGKEVANAMHEYQTASDKMTLRSNQIKYLEKSVDYTMELLKYTSNTNYTDVLTSEERLLSAFLVNLSLQQN